MDEITAFPAPDDIDANGQVFRHAQPGMTLQDYFATKDDCENDNRN